MNHKLVVVKGESMSPTMHDGDLAVLHISAPETGKIAVAEVPQAWEPNTTNQRMVKRVVAMSGDKVTIAQGKLFVNGSENSRIVHNCGDWSGTVPEGRLMIAGDNENNSIDSIYRICNKQSEPFIPLDSVVFAGTIEKFV